MRAGTCRGVALPRICWRMRSPESPGAPQSSLEAHEQHDPLVVAPVLPDYQPFEHLRQLLDLTVDFGRADPHATRIQHRIRAAMDDHAVVRCQLDVVAMVPD